LDHLSVASKIPEVIHTHDGKFTPGLFKNLNIKIGVCNNVLNSYTKFGKDQVKVLSLDSKYCVKRYKTRNSNVTHAQISPVSVMVLQIW